MGCIRVYVRVHIYILYICIYIPYPYAQKEREKERAGYLIFRRKGDGNKITVSMG